MEVKNRLIMAAMGHRVLDRQGYPTPRFIDYYVERARGGVGLITAGVFGVMREYRCPHQAAIYDDTFVPAIKKFTDAVHTHGSKVALQLQHPGISDMTVQTEKNISTSEGPGADQPDRADFVAPSAIPYIPTGVTPRELTKGEILYIVGSFARAGRRAKEAGADAVEIHAAHGYLISEFMSCFFNKREDEYGGGPEKRARFACEIISRVRESVGPDFPIIARISGEDRLRSGNSLEDTLRQVPLLVEAGADAIHVSAGLRYLANPIPSYMDRPGTFVALAGAVKKTVNVPVVAVGRLGDPILAERVLQEGKADFIALGRPLMADPELPNKAREGRLEDIVRCLSCNNCLLGPRGERTSACTVNPSLLREREFVVKPAVVPKKVMVIGGGLAGMEAACILAEKGHIVSIFEQSDRLGGQWNIASQQEGKTEYGAFTRRLSARLHELGVVANTNKKVTSDVVKKTQPDVVVLATGATPATLDVPGANGKNVAQANDVLARTATVGQRVVVIGGRYTAMETACFLAQQGKNVTLVTRRNLGRDVKPSYTYLELRDKLVDLGVRVFQNSPVHEIADDGVSIVCGRELMFLKADTVVLAVGAKPENGLAKELQGLAQEIYSIGDCIEPRNAMVAINEAADIALKI